MDGGPDLAHWSKGIDPELLKSLRQNLEWNSEETMPVGRRRAYFPSCFAFVRKVCHSDTASQTLQINHKIQQDQGELSDSFDGGTSL